MRSSLFSYTLSTPIAPVELPTFAIEGREPQGDARALGLHRLLDVPLVETQLLRQLGHGRRPTQLSCQHFACRHELQRDLGWSPRHADDRRAVAEVALDLTRDGRNGIAGEVGAAIRIEAVDRLDQADRPDLDEVLESFATVGVPTSQRAHQR